MRNRDYFLPSISSVIVFGLIWFLSCAHQNRMREEGDAGFEDAASAEQTEPQAEMAQADAATSETQAQATEGNEKTPQEEPASETPTAENQNAAPQENAGEMASAEVPPSTSEPVAEPKMEEPSVDQVQISEPVPTPRVWVSRLPKIPSRALKRKGSHLNRFYFSRKGDTPKSVSQLLYSDTQHAKKLVAWNGKNWVPGKLLFYTSPVDPAEKTMRSFYKERQVVPEEYRVSNGDWLTRIAKKKLGHTRSWREIAVVNGLKRPNDIEVGQLLAIYPKDLLSSPRNQEESLANNEVVGNLPMIEAPQKSNLPKLPPSKLLGGKSQEAPTQPMGNPQEANAQPSADASQEAAAPQGNPEAAGEMNTASSESPAAGATNWNQVVEQNSVAILIGGAVIVLLLALAARKKRQRMQASSQKVEPSGEDFSENTPSKFRKR